MYGHCQEYFVGIILQFIWSMSHGCTLTTNQYSILNQQGTADQYDAE